MPLTALRTTSVPIQFLPPLQQEPDPVLQGYEFHLTLFVLVWLGKLEDLVHAPGNQRLEIGVMELDSYGRLFEVGEQQAALGRVPRALLMPRVVADEAGPNPP